MLFFFFFQAEDGIRDWSVTGVQTCALPICPHLLAAHHEAVAVGLGARPERGQVAPGAGLAEELAPELVGGEDGREEAALLRLAAVRDERRAGVVDAHAVTPGCASKGP